MRDNRFALLLLAAIPGCAIVYEGRYPYDEGWRQATITEVGPATQMDELATVDCRGRAGEDRRGLFARVTYPFARNMRSAIVPLDREAHPGQAIFINVNTCGAALAEQTR